ncbi:MAG: glycosyltransferase [Burkholderiaceae bacterium]|nr:glycosyltransferase [Burkholderiaceae bacterium]
MNILMLCSGYPNYVPDLLLHGLRKLFGESVVDYPRKDVLYQGICGQPNLDKIDGLMADDAAVDRDDVGGKMAKGFYDYVICDIRAFKESLSMLQSNICPLAIVDGEDAPAPIAPGPFVILRRETRGTDNAIPLPMALPAEVLAWIDRHADAPKTHSIGFLGSRSKFTPDRNVMLDELARIFPDNLVSSWSLETQPQGRDDYYRKLQSCKVVLTLPGAGFDTFRYWENAACGGLHVAKSMPLFIEEDFRDGSEIMRFTGVYELAAMVERVLGGRLDWREFGQRSHAWLKAHHTTERRAQQSIDNMKRAFLR